MEDTLAFDVIPWINLGSPIGGSNRRIGQKEEEKSPSEEEKERSRCDTVLSDRAWVSFSKRASLLFQRRERKIVPSLGHQHATVTIATTHHAN